MVGEITEAIQCLVITVRKKKKFSGTRRLDVPVGELSEDECIDELWSRILKNRVLCKSSEGGTGKKFDLVVER